MADNLTGTSKDTIIPGVNGENTGAGPAIQGKSVNGRGVVGISVNNYGMRAHSDNIAGLRASSTNSRGIEGNSKHAEAIMGFSETGIGVAGQGATGVAGFSSQFRGVYGKSIANAGVVGESDQLNGVYGVSHNPAHAAISAHSLGFDGKPMPNGLAGLFEGNVIVTGTVTALNDIICGKADFAEDFDIIAYTEPGEVMVLTESGALAPSTKAYDRKVVGVLSGAGIYQPGIILDKQSDKENRQPVAMMGKVYCKVDADSAPIETGDLLTTSDTPGYAMKAADSLRAFGAVIGKALASLQSGKGLIPMLVVLQ